MGIIDFFLVMSIGQRPAIKSETDLISSLTPRQCSYWILMKLDFFFWSNYYDGQIWRRQCFTFLRIESWLNDYVVMIYCNPCELSETTIFISVDGCMTLLVPELMTRSSHAWHTPKTRSPSQSIYSYFHHTT